MSKACSLTNMPNDTILQIVILEGQFGRQMNFNLLNYVLPSLALYGGLLFARYNMLSLNQMA